MSDWMIAERRLEDGRWLAVYPLTYGRARLTVSAELGADFYDDGW